MPTMRSLLLRIFLAALPFASVAAALQDPAGLNSGLVAWWKLDETGGAQAADSSGNSLHGKLVGTPQWRPGGGTVGGALELSGSGDYVLIGSESKFDFTERMTVAAWIKVVGFDKNWQAIVAKGDTSWRIARDRDRDCAQFAVNSIPREQLLKGRIKVDDGQWHHVAGVYDGGKMYLYIDGVLDLSTVTTTKIPVNDFPVTIGENAEAKGRFWHGLIDEVRIYGRALSPAEVAILARPPAGTSQTIEDERVRAVLGSAVPGNKGPLHQHLVNRVMVRLDPGYQRQELEDGTVRDNRFKAGDVNWDPAGPKHTSVNAGTNPYRTAEIELKKQGGGPVQFPADDPVKVDPQHYRVELENDQVRVLRVRIGPRETVYFHQHVLPYIVVPFTEQALWVTLADGFGREFRSPAGRMLVGSPGAHSEANLSDAPFEAIMVELKAR
jgi:hypothetical protein